jgi:hypothetical protein
MWRDPTAEEAHVLALAELDSGLKQFELAYASALADFKREAILFIGGHIAKGTLAVEDILDADAFTSFPGRAQAKAVLLEILGRIADWGKEQVVAELGRQSVSGKIP